MASLDFAKPYKKKFCPTFFASIEDIRCNGGWGLPNALGGVSTPRLCMWYLCRSIWYRIWRFGHWGKILRALFSSCSPIVFNIMSSCIPSVEWWPARTHHTWQGMLHPACRCSYHCNLQKGNLVVKIVYVQKERLLTKLISYVHNVTGLMTRSQGKAEPSPMQFQSASYLRASPPRHISPYKQ